MQTRLARMRLLCDDYIGFSIIPDDECGLMVICLNCEQRIQGGGGCVARRFPNGTWRQIILTEILRIYEEWKEARRVE